MRYLSLSNSETESGVGIRQGLGEGKNGHYCLIGTLLYRNGEKVLKILTVDSVQYSLNYTLKVIKMANFMLHIFCHNKKYIYIYIPKRHTNKSTQFYIPSNKTFISFLSPFTLL